MPKFTAIGTWRKCHLGFNFVFNPTVSRCCRRFGTSHSILTHTPNATQVDESNSEDKVGGIEVPEGAPILN